MSKYIDTLTQEQRNELAAAIAGDIYRRATILQCLQLVQTQCSNQANDILDKASEEEIKDFLKQLDTAKKEKTEKNKEKAPVN